MVGAEHVVSNVEFAEVLQDTHAIYRRQTYMCCSALQCSVLQCMRCSVLQCSVLQCSVLQRVAVWCSVLQCVAV